MVTANSAEEAIETLRSDISLSAVLCDVVMTGLVERQVELPDDRVVLAKPLQVDRLLETLGPVLEIDPA